MGYGVWLSGDEVDEPVAEHAADKDNCEADVEEGVVPQSLGQVDVHDVLVVLERPQGH